MGEVGPVPWTREIGVAGSPQTDSALPAAGRNDRIRTPRKTYRQVPELTLAV